MQLWRHAFLLLLTVSSLAVATSPPAVPAAAHPLQLAASGLTMDQAVRMVEQKYRARVVKAESQRDNGQTVYVLRLLDESGKVWTVHVDAVSGSVRQ